MKLQTSVFGRLPDGRNVNIYTMTNKFGTQAAVMDYGAALVRLLVADKKGKFADITLGHDGIDGYLTANPYFGCTTGRFANRICRGKFRLKGVEYQLAQNNNGHHLHGGVKGLDKVLWNARIADNGIQFTYISPDGEENYPGNLHIAVMYSLTDENELIIQYQAQTDKPTIVNLTNHTYWNLAGSGDILSHELTLNADGYTEVDNEFIPTGKILKVDGSNMDFRKPTTIGSRIAATEYGGYDHNYVLNKTALNHLDFAARVRESLSGRVMEIFTTEPGIQFYTGNFLDGTIKGKAGAVYCKHAGFCLETQHFPDSPNKAHFPSTVLEPGQKFKSTTVHKFMTE